MLSLAAALTAVSCVGELDLVGRACPCPQELVCDPATQTCARRGAIDGKDGGAIDARVQRDAELAETGPAMDAAADGGFVPEAGADTGIDAGPMTCSIDAECRDATKICESNTCVPRCDAPGGACAGTDVCSPATGRCLPGDLELGTMCSLNGQCQTGLCLGITGQRPLSFCSEACGSTSDCPLGMGCRALSQMSFCVPGYIQDPPVPFSEPSGGMCTEANPCQSQVCNTTDSVCVERCSRDSDCGGFGDNCWLWVQAGPVYGQLCIDQPGSAAGAACTADANCASGLCSRYTNTCSALCCTDFDCPVGETCGVYDHDAANLTKICRPVTAGNGGRNLGESCTTNLDCVTDVCVPEDDANPNGPKVCSTTCCIDEDCDALPSGGRCWPMRGPLMGTLVGTCLPD